MNRLLLFLLLSGFGYTQKYQPQFSTAGFYQTDKSVREAINFNVGWRFIKQDVTVRKNMILMTAHGAL